MLRSLFVFCSCFVVLCIAKGGIPTSCGPNEELKCVNKCPPERTCRNRDIRFSCLAVYEPCENKCVCKEGYSRNFLGTCITNKQCDKCSRKNEFFACDSACDNECPTLHQQNRTNCPIKNIVCNQQCYCDDGYARDDKGNCVIHEKCPPLLTCEDENEVYRHCKTTCPPDTCFSIVALFDCSAEPPCKPGCACKPGFLRKERNSTCVPVCDCNEIKNTVYCP